MLKTNQIGVLHHCVIQKAGAVLDLPAEDEARLVRQGWCSYVEEPAQPEDGPRTDLPEEESKPLRSRKR